MTNPDKIIKKHNCMERVGIVSIEEVFKAIKPPRESTHIIFHKKVVKIDSQRLLTFYYKGIICASCGLVGLFFAVERNTADSSTHKYHLNLYAIDHENEEVLLTRDHIHPKSKGGKDNLRNAQTLCKPCNENYSDRIK